MSYRAFWVLGIKRISGNHGFSCFLKFAVKNCSISEQYSRTWNALSGACHINEPVFSSYGRLPTCRDNASMMVPGLAWKKFVNGNWKLLQPCFTLVGWKNWCAVSRSSSLHRAATHSTVDHEHASSVATVFDFYDSWCTQKREKLWQAFISPVYLWWQHSLSIIFVLQNGCLAIRV